MNANTFEKPRPLYFVVQQEVLKAMAYTDGNIMQAAALLGVKRDKVYRVLKKMGFTP